MVSLNQLFLENPKLYRKVVITPFTLAILKTIINFKITTTRELAEFCEIPTCTAGGQMRLLADKGYLKRVMNVGTEKGKRGEYIYSVVK